MKHRYWASPYFIFLLLFVALPLVMVLAYAFQDSEGHFTWMQFVKFANDADTISTFIFSLQVALDNTAICLLLGYPTAWILANSELNRSSVTVMLFILPMWINMLVRTLATVALFDFLSLPLGKGALYFGMVYNFLPFMILPIYTTLTKIDNSYAQAAQDMGATPWQVLTKVTLPMSMPGVRSGILMVLMPTISTFAIAELLTMNKIKLFGTTIQENINNGLWNYGACLALIMLAIMGITMLYTDTDTVTEEEKGGLI